MSVLLSAVLLLQLAPHLRAISLKGTVRFCKEGDEGDKIIKASAKEMVLRACDADDPVRPVISTVNGKNVYATDIITVESFTPNAYPLQPYNETEKLSVTAQLRGTGTYDGSKGITGVLEELSLFAKPLLKLWNKKCGWQDVSQMGLRPLLKYQPFSKKQQVDIRDIDLCWYVDPFKPKECKVEFPPIPPGSKDKTTTTTMKAEANLVAMHNLIVDWMGLPETTNYRAKMRVNYDNKFAACIVSEYKVSNFPPKPETDKKGVAGKTPGKAE